MKFLKKRNKENYKFIFRIQKSPTTLHAGPDYKKKQNHDDIIDNLNIKIENQKKIVDTTKSKKIEKNAKEKINDLKVRKGEIDKKIKIKAKTQIDKKKEEYLKAKKMAEKRDNLEVNKDGTLTEMSSDGVSYIHDKISLSDYKKNLQESKIAVLKKQNPNLKVNKDGTLTEMSRDGTSYIHEGISVDDYEKFEQEQLRERLYTDSGVNVTNTSIIFPNGEGIPRLNSSKINILKTKDGKYVLKIENTKKIKNKKLTGTRTLKIEIEKGSIKFVNKNTKEVYLKSTLKDFKSSELQEIAWKKKKYIIPEDSGFYELFEKPDKSEDEKGEEKGEVYHEAREEFYGLDGADGITEDHGDFSPIGIRTSALERDDRTLLKNPDLDEYFPLYRQDKGSKDVTMANELTHRWLNNYGFKADFDKNSFKGFEGEFTPVITSDFGAHELMSDSASIATNPRDFFRVLGHDEIDEKGKQLPIKEKGYTDTVKYAKDLFIKIMKKKNPKFNYKDFFDQHDATPGDVAMLAGESGFNSKDLESVRSSYIEAGKEILNLAKDNPSKKEIPEILKDYGFSETGAQRKLKIYFGININVKRSGIGLDLSSKDVHLATIKDGKLTDKKNKSIILYEGSKVERVVIEGSISDTMELTLSDGTKYYISNESFEKHSNREKQEIIKGLTDKKDKK